MSNFRLAGKPVEDGYGHEDLTQRLYPFAVERIKAADWNVGLPSFSSKRAAPGNPGQVALRRSPNGFYNVVDSAKPPGVL